MNKPILKPKSKNIKAIKQKNDITKYFPLQTGQKYDKVERLKSREIKKWRPVKNCKKNVEITNYFKCTKRKCDFGSVKSKKLCTKDLEIAKKVEFSPLQKEVETINTECATQFSTKSAKKESFLHKIFKPFLTNSPVKNEEAKNDLTIDFEKDFLFLVTPAYKIAKEESKLTKLFAIFDEKPSQKALNIENRSENTFENLFKIFDDLEKPKNDFNALVDSTNVPSLQKTDPHTKVQLKLQNICTKNTPSEIGSQNYALFQTQKNVLNHNENIEKNFLKLSIEIDACSESEKSYVFEIVKNSETFFEKVDSFLGENRFSQISTELFSDQDIKTQDEKSQDIFNWLEGKKCSQSINFDSQKIDFIKINSKKNYSKKIDSQKIDSQKIDSQKIDFQRIEDNSEILDNENLENGENSCIKNKKQIKILENVSIQEPKICRPEQKNLKTPILPVKNTSKDNFIQEMLLKDKILLEKTSKNNAENLTENNFQITQNSFQKTQNNSQNFKNFKNLAYKPKVTVESLIKNHFDTTEQTKIAENKKITSISDLFLIFENLEPHPEKNKTIFTKTQFQIFTSAEKKNYTCTNSNVFETDTNIHNGLKTILENYSFKFDTQKDSAFNFDKNQILKLIDNIFSGVMKDIKNETGPKLILRDQKMANCYFKNNRLHLKSNFDATKITVAYEKKASQFKFSIIMFLLGKIRELIISGIKINKREIYYQIKNMVKSQRDIDNAINCISCILNVGQWDLNIIAQKGLVFGNLKITLSSNEIINCNVPGTQIPQDVNEIIKIESNAHFVLVVEKESIFNQLLQEELPIRLVMPFILITGKGFPDLNTLLFVRKLWMTMSIPVFIFVDADPDGIHIMTCYRFGSVGKAHLSQHLTVPTALWVGLYPSDICKLNLNRQVLTERERKKIKSLLEMPFVKEHPKIGVELKVLLDNNYKAEIEGLIKSGTFLSSFYFPSKLSNCDFI